MLGAHANVVLGKSPYTHIPSVIEQFSVGIIPYDTRLKTVKYAYPMKLFEYFYMGKPIVSSVIDALSQFSGDIICVDSLPAWEQAILSALTKKMSTQKKNTLKQLARNNSWERKVSVILQTISVIEAS
jgi:hypothetical protein